MLDLIYSLENEIDSLKLGGILSRLSLSKKLMCWISHFGISSADRRQLVLPSHFFKPHERLPLCLIKWSESAF
ncbi:hypothetical protein [Chamaesiphon sp. VAR_48_metabat_135_sub]|uniref:hypothetical protein n=1 Tax=Chamaesiphon sp. VAR_48_metabat_135_sub TaxID=2964699 RepID=UPI00286ADEA8|nr:hypothetical protein [Chamaesiphon sp. VAR_48_metabat_135_sub]